MKDQPQSREELETKVKKYKKGLKVFLGTMIVGGIFMFSAPIRVSYFLNRPPLPIFKDYTNAQITLNRLENKRKDLSEMVNLPYKTKETNSAIDILYKDWEEQAPVINRAIAGVEEDISKMKKDPELKQYFINEKNINKYFNYSFGGGLLLLVGGGSMASRSKIKKYEYEQKLKRFQKT